MQLELFTDNPADRFLEHVHVFRTVAGPHETNPPISVGGTDSRWCWTCHSWVNRVGISQWQAWGMDTAALALTYARMVKAGEISRHDAYRLMHTCQHNFAESVEVIDIALGEINAGKGK